ncbi:Uncharacterised protein [Pseudomonas putida]|jgi:hypothetical protein|nr:hypothetical protein SAMN05216307_0242 [Pseudomonas putida]SKB84664.1 hypothetical protein SAMN05216307_0776 [Pseudomonas putida]SKC01855.1 hypothetical protein SAMN05216307_2247 [Pseudomonas putida]SKC12213.1 hypothetical protein SAMN05216307_3439 [Pseudomonas putida]SKC14550.1 hypothetical protein SAMN05216307_3924 [Pseudomonas putida]
MAGGKFSVKTPSASLSNLEVRVSVPENFSPALDTARQFGRAALQPQPQLAGLAPPVYISGFQSA